MAYEQVKTPNLDPVIIQDGKALTDWLGWCLAYVQTAFDTPWAGDTAWNAWSTKVTKKHEDRNWPKNVYFPVWFDGYWDGERYGHVGIAYDNGSALSIWCSPISHEPYADRWGSMEEVERNYSMKYVGWSEDLGGVDLIKQKVAAESAPQKEKTTMVDEAGLNVLYKFYLASPITEYGYKNRLGKQTFAQAQKEIMESAAAKALVKKRADEQTGFINHLPDMYKVVVKLPEQLQEPSKAA